MASTFSPLDTAISNFEGFGNTITAPTITYGNNPGAVQFGPLAQSFGSSGAGPNGAALFGSLDDGLNALHAVESNIFGQGNTSPDAFVTAYEGGVSVPNYAASIASDLGITTSDPIPAGATQVPAAQATQPSTANSTGTAQEINPATGQPYTSNQPGLVAPPGSTPTTGFLDTITNWFSGIPSFARIGAFIVGAGLILGGIFFLRPVQQAVQSSTAAVARGVALVS